jgi:hypothetical protein
MPVWWGNNGFQWGWGMRFLRGAIGVALSAACVSVPAGHAWGQSNQTPADQVRALGQIIRTNGSRIKGTSEYHCSNGNTTVSTDGAGGVVQEERLNLWQGPSTVGPVSPFHNLYLRTQAMLLRNGSVSIIPTYAVTPQGQEEPLSEGVTLPTVVFPYISSHANKTPPALLVGMEKAVRETCSNKFPETIGPVLRALSGQSTFQM